MALGEVAYRWALRVVRGAAPLLSGGSSKVARSLGGRRDADRILAAWGRDHRDPARPLAWVHAPSVGEGLQARAVLEAWLALRPDLQVVYTYFSPSAEALGRRMPADVAGFLPWDLPGPVGDVLDALAPDLLAFGKTEVWPTLTAEARDRGVPLALVGATLPASAGRLRWPARVLLRPAFGRLDRVAAIAEEDGRRFARLGVPPERVVVTGDPAIDSAWRRAGEADPQAPFLAAFHAEPAPTVVAGSTWAPDEAVLLPAAVEVRRGVPDLRLVVAPHEPGEEHVGRLEADLRRSGWRPVRLSALEAAGRVGPADAVVVDRVGVLAHLYTVATVAYVGGGFHRHGLHSVLEPAAAGVPVAFGPRHGNARAAGELLGEGGAEEAGDAGELAWILGRWLADGGEGASAGERAFRYIERHRGAARRTALLLDELLRRDETSPREGPEGGTAGPGRGASGPGGAASGSTDLLRG